MSSDGDACSKATGADALDAIFIEIGSLGNAFGVLAKVEAVAVAVASLLEAVARVDVVVGVLMVTVWLFLMASFFLFCDSAHFSMFYWCSVAC